MKKEKIESLKSNKIKSTLIDITIITIVVRNKFSFITP